MCVRQMVFQARCAVLFVVLVSACLAAKALAQDLPSSGDFRGHKVIVLDPGHGGHDHGAVGPSGLAEKTVVLTLARKLKETLERDYTVHLTRDGDYWLDMDKRTAAANHHRADAFVSLHTGGSSLHQARGMTVFFYEPGPGQGLALQEEAFVGETGETLRPWDQMQGVHITESRCLANFVHSRMVAELNPWDRGVHGAPCLVLQGTDMPAILVEVGYVSHPDEEKELQDPRIISAFAEAIGQGLRDFFRQTSGCVNEEGMIEEEVQTGRGAAW
jgi:N-acetylmuramoyl-L-alanine amidase